MRTECIVIAPEIRPSLPVAYDSSSVETKTTRGWTRWTGSGEETLMNQLTKNLETRASSEESIQDVRDDCRKSIAQFVQTWLLNHEHWEEGKFTSIKVLFPDEKHTHADQFPATLVLDEQVLEEPVE